MVAVGSVIYQSAYGYIDDFLDSLENQTYKDFQVILINDDILEKDLNKVLDRHTEILNKICIVCLGGGQEIYQTRIELFKNAKSLGTKLLILGDCDDFFSEDRVEKTVKCYEENADYGFFYNDIVLLTGEKMMKDLPDETCNAEDIIEFNYLGLSNSALNLDLLEDSFLDSLHKGNTKIFDWYLFSRMLLSMIKGKYVKDTSTYYRIHDNNLAGISGNGHEAIKKEYSVKLEHYRLLACENELFLKYYQKYENLDCSKVVANKNEKGFWWNLIRIGG